MASENEQEQQVLDYFKKTNDWLTVQMAAKGTDLNWNTVAKYILVLEAKGKLERKNMGKYKIYKVKKKR